MMSAMGLSNYMARILNLTWIIWSSFLIASLLGPVDVLFSMSFIPVLISDSL